LENLAHAEASTEFTLNGISLRIPTYSRTAIVGPSGSCKSTVGRLIAGLLPTTHGSVPIGGIPSWTLANGNYAACVGMVRQDFYIFAGRTLDNVRYAYPQATPEEAMRACKLAGLLPYIESLPEKENILGQRGTGLSGGQKQRLSWARLILQNPDIIIGDEPSSNVDQDNAKRFFHEVLAAFKDKTIIIITHDQNNLDWADRIVRIANGTITESIKFRNQSERALALA
jgi:ABC-type multidrug transport system fused ATPase/permease subunit